MGRLNHLSWLAEKKIFLSGKKMGKRKQKGGGGGGILSSVRVKLRDKGRNRNTTNNKEGRIKSTQMEAEKKGIN